MYQPFDFVRIGFTAVFVLLPTWQQSPPFFTLRDRTSYRVSSLQKTRQFLHTACRNHDGARASDTKDVTFAKIYFSVLNVCCWTVARVTFAKQPANMTRLMSFLPHACINGIGLVCFSMRQRKKCPEILMFSNDIKMIQICTQWGFRTFHIILEVLAYKCLCSWELW